jgi:hypothetical protein
MLVAPFFYFFTEIAFQHMLESKFPWTGAADDASEVNVIPRYFSLPDAFLVRVSDF